MLYDANGAFFWVNSALWSLIYIVLVYNYARIRLIPLLIACEFLALLTTFQACFEYYTEDFFFYGNYEPIINALFIAELLIIGVGILQSGIIKRIYSARLPRSNRDTDTHRRLLPCEKPV
jgi:hypothetical protein